MKFKNFIINIQDKKITLFNSKDKIEYDNLDANKSFDIYYSNNFLKLSSIFSVDELPNLLSSSAFFILVNKKKNIKFVSKLINQSNDNFFFEIVSTLNQVNLKEINYTSVEKFDDFFNSNKNFEINSLNLLYIKSKSIKESYFNFFNIVSRNSENYYIIAINIKKILLIPKGKVPIRIKAKSRLVEKIHISDMQKQMNIVVKFWHDDFELFSKDFEAINNKINLNQIFSINSHDLIVTKKEIYRKYIKIKKIKVILFDNISIRITNKTKIDFNNIYKILLHLDLAKPFTKFFNDIVVRNAVDYKDTDITIRYFNDQDLDSFVQLGGLIGKNNLVILFDSSDVIFSKKIQDLIYSLSEKKISIAIKLNSTEDFNSLYNTDVRILRTLKYIFLGKTNLRIFDYSSLYLINKISKDYKFNLIYKNNIVNFNKEKIIAN